MLRQLFWVYGVFIVVMSISFGVLTCIHAPAMAAGDPIARSICALIAIFWGLRLLVQWFVFSDLFQMILAVFKAQSHLA